jgi:membrane associated rhomboid family serine protease
MKAVFTRFFSSLPTGARLLLLAYALGFPVALAGHYAHVFNLYGWLPLAPASVWRGQVWRLLTYAFLPGGVVDWAVSLFWLATLLSVLGRNWSSLGLWLYALLTVLAGAVPIVLLKSGSELLVVGNAAMIFGLLVDWYQLYGRERIILLGFGEISVRQAAILVAIIEALILLFCCGWFLLPSMMCGGVAGWLYLAVRRRLVMSPESRRLDSERIARLEL